MNNFVKKLYPILILIFLFTCGIELPIPILKPPLALSTSEISDTFVFQNYLQDERNIDSFKGFEIYYKFYNTVEEAEAEKNITSYETIVKNTQSGFWRINFVTDNERIDKPLIVMNDKREITRYRVDFSALNNAHITTEVGSIVISDQLIYRGVKDELNVYKSFFDIEATDSDVKYITDLTKEIYLTLYVFSYGIYQLSSELYSQPVWLNKIQLILN